MLMFTKDVLGTGVFFNHAIIKGGDSSHFWNDKNES